MNLGIRYDHVRTSSDGDYSGSMRFERVLPPLSAEEPLD